MYRKIDSKIWYDPAFTDLSQSAMLLFFYLITNDHAHLSGLYRLPPAYIVADIGTMTTDTAVNAMQELIDAELIQYDWNTQTVWVVNLLKYQGSGPKVINTVQNQVDAMCHTYLVKNYTDYYTTVTLPQHYRDLTVTLPRQDRAKKKQKTEEETEDRRQNVEACIAHAPKSAVCNDTQATHTLIKAPKKPDVDIDKLFSWWCEAMGKDVNTLETPCPTSRTRNAIRKLVAKFGYDGMKKGYQGYRLWYDKLPSKGKFVATFRLSHPVDENGNADKERFQEWIDMAPGSATNPDTFEFQGKTYTRAVIETYAKTAFLSDDKFRQDLVTAAKQSRPKWNWPK